MDESAFRRALGMAFTLAVARLVVGVGAITGPIVVHVMPWELMPGAPAAARIAAGALIGIGALYLIAFAAYWLRAPYLQRNETRQERDEARSILNQMEKSQPLGAAGIAAAQSRAVGTIRSRNQRP